LDEFVEMKIEGNETLKVSLIYCAILYVLQLAF